MKGLLMLFLLIPFFGYSQEEQLPLFTITELKKVASSSINSGIPDQFLISKGLDLLDYKENESFKKKWTYAYASSSHTYTSNGYTQGDTVAPLWISYTITDFKEKKNHYSWGKGWYKNWENYPYYEDSKTDIRIQYSGYNINYNNIIAYIKQNYKKEDVSFDEESKCFVYKYSNGDFSFIFYKVNTNNIIHVIYSNPIIKKAIDELRINNLLLEKKWHKNLGKQYYKNGHSICECKDFVSGFYAFPSIYHYDGETGEHIIYDDSIKCMCDNIQDSIGIDKMEKIIKGALCKNFEVKINDKNIDRDSLISDKIVILHSFLVKEGYQVAADVEEFRTDIKNRSNSDKLHATLIKDGYDLPESSEDFYNILFPVQATTK